MTRETETMAEPENPAPGAVTAPPENSRRGYIMQGVVAVLVLVAAVFVARSFLQTSPTAGSRPLPEREARLVEVTPMQARDYQPTITGWGTLVPSRSLSVQAQVSGAVEAISPQLEPGMTVQAGDQLLSLEDLSYRAAVTEAESALAEAEANLALEQGQQAIARREFELLSEDAATWGGKPGPGGAEDLVLRQPQLRIARAAVTAAEARLAQARLNLERATIAAPFDALVAARAVTLGSQVSPGSELARLIGLTTWWIEVRVGADQLRWLETPLDPQDPAPVELRYPGVWPAGTTRTGYVLRILKELEADGNLARVLVAIDDPLAVDSGPGSVARRPPLLLGAFMQAGIRGQHLQDVFVLEPRWLRENSSVWVMDADQKLEIRPVEVLYRDEDAVVVSAGLTAGDRLITSRLSTPAEGMPLRTEARTDSAASSKVPADDSASASAPAQAGGGPNHG